MALSDHLRAKDWTFSSTSRAAQRRNEIALNLLLASLAMFFVAALVGYLLIRFGPERKLPDIRLPAVLWFSTACAVAGGICLRRALRSVRRERQDLFRPQLLAAFVLGAAFCAAQSVGMAGVLGDYLALMRGRPVAAVDERPHLSLALRQGRVPPKTATDPTPEFPGRRDAAVVEETRLGGLFFVLILLHALHFVGGMAALTVVTRRGFAGRYDHEYHAGVKLCARYWAFLDVVWVVMFGTFLVTTADWPRLASRFGG